MFSFCKRKSDSATHTLKSTYSSDDQIINIVNLRQVLGKFERFHETMTEAQRAMLIEIAYTMQVRCHAPLLPLHFVRHIMHIPRGFNESALWILTAAYAPKWLDKYLKLTAADALKTSSAIDVQHHVVYREFLKVHGIAIDDDDMKLLTCVDLSACSDSSTYVHTLEATLKQVQAELQETIELLDTKSQQLNDVQLAHQAAMKNLQFRYDEKLKTMHQVMMDAMKDIGS